MEYDHTKLKKQYEQDVAEYGESAYTKWQFKRRDQQYWTNFFNSMPSWHTDVEYRRDPNFFKEIPQPTIKKETTMSYQSVTIKHTTTINGKDITTMSKDDLINMVSNCEGDLAALNKLTTKSKTITARIKDVQNTIDEIVKLMDA